MEPHHPTEVGLGWPQGADFLHHERFRPANPPQQCCSPLNEQDLWSGLYRLAGVEVDNPCQRGASYRPFAKGMSMSKSLTVLIVNADEQRVRGLYEAALSPLGDVRVHFVNRNGLSARYDEKTGLAREYPTVRQLLATVAPDWKPDDPLLGIGFSAGCWAWRAWLRDEGNRANLACVMFIDGLHAGLDAHKHVVESALSGVYTYADECRTSNGQKLLIQQNSDIQTELCSPHYASTSMTARALLDHLKVEPRNAPDDGETAGVIVRSYPGNGPAAHVQALMAAGPELIRQYVVPFFRRLLSDDVVTTPASITAIEPWKDPNLTLGQRCLLLCQHELEARVQANPTGPNTGPAVAKYFAGAVRNGKPLGIGSGNWCMLSQSWVLSQCLVPGETAPHQWRAGVIEAVEDAKALKLYHPVAEVRTGAFRPMPGDLAIWDRSIPGDINTSWYRHVNRVCWYNGQGSAPTSDDVFEAIGGNEGRRTWVSAPRQVNSSRLLGFIEYPRSVASDVKPQGDAWTEHEEPAQPSDIEPVEQVLRGIDVSHHQPSIDFQKVKEQGQAWVICRATYGTRPDETFGKHWKAASAAGLKVSAYHFLRYKSGQSAQAQVDAFLSALHQQVDPAALGVPVALDVEANAAYDDPLNHASYVEQLELWLTKVTEATHVAPLVYTGPGFWNTLPGVESFCPRHPLWVAHYTKAAKPMLPKGWSEYRIWQFTGTGRLAGIAGTVDLNEGKPWA
jgi:GH25 family lysozyme M1 (1,4-beta-N-acetylmuramidase)